MKYFFVIFLLLTGCISHGTVPKENTLLSIQLLDRNGFSETISTKERLALHAQTDFLIPQPYQKVIRIFGRDRAGKSHSKITTYHSNGFIWQYLESVDGRAHGNGPAPLVIPRRHLDGTEARIRIQAGDTAKRKGQLDEIGVCLRLFLFSVLKL